ncbi:M48 family metallopeptidase [Chloroflexota bacterium]
MDQPLTIKVNGIGPVLIEHSRRARRMSISIKVYQGVRVAVPRGVSFNKALEFVHLKKPWIEKHLAMIARHETERRALAELATTIDRTKAGRYLTGRLNRLARAHGFTFNRVSIRSQKTRWGSCSRNNNISLNVKLVLLPEDLVDYVILHELAHTRIHNHSKGFWEELDRYVGNGKAFASRLRKYGYSLP